MQALECAVLDVGAHTPWAAQWVAQAEVHRHLSLTRLALGPAGSIPSVDSLQSIQSDLYRFEICLLPVDADNLSWTRTALAGMCHLTVPLMGLVRGLRAEALGDLLQLGMSEFVFNHADVQELRARVYRLLRSGASRPAQCVCTAASRRPSPLPVSTDLPASRVADPASIYARAGRVAPSASDESGSFREAKQRLIDAFEIDFLHRTLRRHGGNVTRAARDSDKHRRAFWALMRKHHIDARVYRSG